MSADLRRAAGELSRAVSRRRWLLAGGLAAAAVAVALPALAPSPPPGTTVLAAARDLAAGTALSAADVTRVQLPAGVAPTGALALEAYEGRRTAGAVRAGEPLTDVRLVGPGLLAGLEDDGLVAVPVRLADPASTALVRPGDRVDVLAASSSPGGPPAASVVAAAVQVLAVPPASEDVEGALLVVATPSATAVRLAGAAVSAQLSVVVLP